MKTIYAESAALQTLLEEAGCGLEPRDAAAVAREALRYVSEEGAWARGTSARPACEIMAESMVLNDDAIVRRPHSHCSRAPSLTTAAAELPGATFPRLPRLFSSSPACLRPQQRHHARGPRGLAPPPAAAKPTGLLALPPSTPQENLTRILVRANPVGNVDLMDSLRALRAASGARIAATQRALPGVQLAINWLLAVLSVLSFPLIRLVESGALEAGAGSGAAERGGGGGRAGRVPPRWSPAAGRRLPGKEGC